MAAKRQDRSDAARNRDDDMKPGRPPRPATEPAGSEGSARKSRTRPGPATGKPQSGAPKPA